MAKIYRTTDIIKLEIGGLVVGISPLSFEQKMNVQAEILKGDALGPMRGASLAVKYALKSIEGIEDQDGKPYQLQFENDKLSDSCWDDLQNISEGNSLTMVCLNLLDKVPSEFIDPNTGDKLKGVKILREGTSTKKK